jgi:hypothetical protein
VNLNASTPYAVTGTDAIDFFLVSVSAARVLAPGATATFDVRFTPSKTSAESATVTVNCSSGNVSLPLQGSGETTDSVYTVTCITTSTPVSDGATVAFPAMSIFNTTAAYTFEIKNLGPGKLGIPAIGALVASSTDQEFSATVPAPGPALAVGGTADYAITVRYTRKGNKLYSDLVTLHTSSASHPTFTFTVTDMQTAPPAPLASNMRLSSPSLATAGSAACAGGNYVLASGTNPFATNAAIVFIGGTAPVLTSLGFVYYVTGSGTSAISIFPLTGGPSSGCTSAASFGATTIYPVDWTFIHLGFVAFSGGVFSVSSHGLAIGDTVYIAATPGSPNLTSGAYVVETVPTANTFTIVGPTLTSSDSFNYLAKVNSTAGAVAFP